MFKRNSYSVLFCGVRVDPGGTPSRGVGPRCCCNLMHFKWSPCWVITTASLSHSIRTGSPCNFNLVHSFQNWIRHGHTIIHFFPTLKLKNIVFYMMSNKLIIKLFNKLTSQQNLSFFLKREKLLIDCSSKKNESNNFESNWKGLLKGFLQSGFFMMVIWMILCFFLILIVLKTTTSTIRKMRNNMPKYDCYMMILAFKFFFVVVLFFALLWLCLCAHVKSTKRFWLAPLGVDTSIWLTIYLAPAFDFFFSQKLNRKETLRKATWLFNDIWKSVQIIGIVICR